MEREDHQQSVDSKRRARMGKIDRLTPEMRALVHEYGFAVVNTMMELGVVKPGQIRHAVETILNEFSPTRGSYSKQGVRTEIVQHLRGVD
jgi:hypothetical protein